MMPITEGQIIKTYNGQPVKCLLGSTYRCPPIEFGFASWLEYYCVIASIPMTEVHCYARDCASIALATIVTTTGELVDTTEEFAQVSEVIGAHIRYCAMRGYWNTEYIIPLCRACCINMTRPRTSRVLTLLDNVPMVRANKNIVARECRRIMRASVQDGAD
jgi:hypothetical protein